MFVLGSLHDEMMEDLLQGDYYKWLLKLDDSSSSYITGRWHYLVIAGYWEYININYMKYLNAEDVYGLIWTNDNYDVEALSWCYNVNNGVYWIKSYV